MSLPFKIRVGGKYRLANGEEVTIERDDGTNIPFRASAHGWFRKDGRHLAHSEYNIDEEIIDNLETNPQQKMEYAVGDIVTVEVDGMRCKAKIVGDKPEPKAGEVWEDADGDFLMLTDEGKWVDVEDGRQFCNSINPTLIRRVTITLNKD